MKKVFLAVLLVVGITAFAQENEGKRSEREKLTPEQKVDFQVKKMIKDLGLSDKQATEVRAIVTKQVQKREEKRNEIKAVKEKQREDMKATIEKEQAAVSADMKKILTPEQFAKWEKNRDERKEKMKERMKEKMMERREKKGLK